MLGPVFKLENLVSLRMHYQAIREIPSSISKLTHLEVLDISHCPSLEAVSSEVTLCKKLSGKWRYAVK